MARTAYATMPTSVLTWVFILWQEAAAQPELDGCHSELGAHRDLVAC